MRAVQAHAFHAPNVLLLVDALGRGLVGAAVEPDPVVHPRGQMRGAQGHKGGLQIGADGDLAKAAPRKSQEFVE